MSESNRNADADAPKSAAKFHWRTPATWSALVPHTKAAFHKFNKGAVGDEQGKIKLAHVPQLVVRGARRVNLPRIAAALSYRTIFGLIPAIVIGLVVLAAFATPQDVIKNVGKILSFARLNEIAIKAEDTDAFTNLSPIPMNVPEEQSFGPLSDGPLTGTSASASDTPAVTVDAARLDKWIEQLVLRVQSIRLGAISIVGVVMLIYAALAMLVEIEKAFNQIFLTPVGRSWARRVPLYWTLLTLGMVGLVATFSVQEGLQRYLDDFAKRGSSIPVVGLVIGHIASYGITVLISTLFFFLAYTTVPNTRVRRRPALIGALCAAIMWEAGKWGFTEYIKYFGGGAKLYGIIALIPIFMLWVYMTWMIVLLGLQITQAIQTYRLARINALPTGMLGILGVMDEIAPAKKNTIIDPAAILPITIAVARRFNAGLASDHSHASGATGVDQQVVADMLERLAGAGILLRVAGDQEGMYTLSRPPESIAAIDVLRVGNSLASVERGPGSALLEELGSARFHALAGKTIADFLPAKKTKPLPESQVGKAATA